MHTIQPMEVCFEINGPLLRKRKKTRERGPNRLSSLVTAASLLMLACPPFRYVPPAQDDTPYNRRITRFPSGLCLSSTSCQSYRRMESYEKVTLDTDLKREMSPQVDNVASPMTPIPPSRDGNGLVKAEKTEPIQAERPYKV